MKSKLILTILVALTLVVTLSGQTTGLAQAESLCDPAYVTQAEKIITVSPNGSNDTANIQCAFDVSLGLGQGAHVMLTAGTFHVGQITVNNFDGAFTGQGARETIITNLPNLYVTYQDFYLQPPSADNPWPGLFLFVNGNIAISDLAILVKGNNPTTGWTFFGIDPPPTELALGIGILGTHANAKIERILIEGEVMENSLYGYNLINGIYFEGFMGELPWAPISGTFEVYSSTFRHLASAAPVFNAVDSTVIISGNRMQDMFYGADIGEIVNTDITVSQNKVDGALFGYWMYGPNTNSNLLIKNNSFFTTYGVMMEYGPGGECLMLGNNLQHTSEAGIFLSEYVSGCTVVGGPNKTNVVDLGSGNTLIGVNNIGVKVGPTIRHLLRP